MRNAPPGNSSPERMSCETSSLSRICPRGERRPCQVASSAGNLAGSRMGSCSSHPGTQGIHNLIHRLVSELGPRRRTHGTRIRTIAAARLERLFQFLLNVDMLLRPRDLFACERTKGPPATLLSFRGPSQPWSTREFCRGRENNVARAPTFAPQRATEEEARFVLPRRPIVGCPAQAGAQPQRLAHRLARRGIVEDAPTVLSVSCRLKEPSRERRKQGVFIPGQ